MIKNQDLIWVEQCRGVTDKAVIQLPIGKFALYAQGDMLIKAEWLPSDSVLRSPQAEFLGGVLLQLQRYWETGEKIFRLKLLKQGTVFRNKVWLELYKIPYAETVTYAALSTRLATSPRAIGGACRHNPFPFIIPCHRVVAVSGVGGYAGKTGGDLLNIKRQLLAHELTVGSSKSHSWH